jgi:hypothetical protein
MRIVGVHYLEFPQHKKPSQDAGCADAYSAPWYPMHAKTFRGGARRKRPSIESEQLGVMPARTQTAKGQQNLVLAAAPIWLRINVNGHHRRAAEKAETQCSIRWRIAWGANFGIDSKFRHPIANAHPTS